jgi:hypothetical protein
MISQEERLSIDVGRRTTCHTPTIVP